jgi:plasmid stabilization system protein ParE
MKIRILPSALADLEEGKVFYEQQGEGLGQYFTNSLFSDIDSLALYGGIHSKHWGYHRLLSRRFPYADYYRMNEDVAEVWRVLDCRQHPRRIKRALTS